MILLKPDLEFGLYQHSRRCAWRKPQMVKTIPGNPFERPVFARARKLCARLPEVVEGESWGHPNFRAPRKIFCAFEMIEGRPSIAFRLLPEEVDALLRRRKFFATPYGRGLWVSVCVDGALDWKLIEKLIDRSYRTVAHKRLVAMLDARA